MLDITALRLLLMDKTVRSISADSTAYLPAAVSSDHSLELIASTIRVWPDKSRSFVFGRRKFKIGDKKCTLVLIKNPVGATQALNDWACTFLTFSLSVLLNANWRDTSWIWDAILKILEMNIPHVIARWCPSSEIARRLRVTGYQRIRLTRVKDLEKFSRPIERQTNHAYILATYICWNSASYGRTTSGQKGDELMVIPISPDNQDFDFD